MDQPHLRPVVPPPVDPTAGGKKRSDPRKRPSKSIPTDRMKFEVQERVLQTLGRVSGPGKRPVNAQQLSAAMNGEVSHYTVSLSHNFFTDCGWVERRARGEYAAAEPLVGYTTRLAADPGNLSKAVESLRAAIRQAWFWRAISPQITNGGAPMTELMVTLMQEAAIGEAHRPQLRNLLEWLRYVGLIVITDDRVRLADGVDPAVAPAEKPTAKPAETPEPAGPVGSGEPPADPKVPESTTQPPGRPGVVVAFDFSFELTADDLAVLTPEQIKALFEAVGTVMAVKTTR